MTHWGAGWMRRVVDMVLLKLRGNRGQLGWRTEPTGTSCWPAQELQEPLCAWALRKTQSKFIHEKNMMKKALESKKANSNKSQMSSRSANCQLHLKLVAMKMLEFFLTYHHKQKKWHQEVFLPLFIPKHLLLYVIHTHTQSESITRERRHSTPLLSEQGSAEP